MAKKFENVTDLKDFIANASPEEIQAVNKELTLKLVKKILLGAAIGGAAVLTVLAIGSAISKNTEDEAILTDSIEDPAV